MAERYDHKTIEEKWQKRWEEARAFEVSSQPSADKLYVLDMFPYPSGEGLHVGHVEGYTATDIYSRYQRMRSKQVLHPMGWDAFGLPAENYAIKTGIHPKETTQKAIDVFRQQIKRLGLSYDWTREVGTHTPEYYRWTQWLFVKFFKKGLVYKKKALVNWDPVDQTVLANEQVLPDGTAERSGAKVMKKALEQWFFKITDYADELIEGLAEVDWPESTKIAQRNWIGRSEGAEIEFLIVGFRRSNAIKVFTTRPDTLFGATYLVFSPEHSWLTQEITNSSAKGGSTSGGKSRISNWKEVEKYIDEAKKKTEIERVENKEKTGVELKGVKAINPATKEEIPIYVADYVLSEYGTGAIMGVPAHDDRDLQFAIKYNLPIKPVIAEVNSVAEIVPELTEAKVKSMRDTGRAHVGGGLLFNSGQFDGMGSEEAKKKITEFVGGQWKRTYRLRDWLISRQRYWGAPIPIVYDPQGRPHAVPEEHLPWILPTDVEFRPTGTSPLGQSKELRERTEKLFGVGWRPEIDTMDTFVCSSWYFFRFTDPHNKNEFASREAMQRWLPVDLYVGGAEHTVLHLLYARFFTKALRDMGYITFGEPFLKLRHQGTILGEDSRKMSKRWGNVVNPDAVVERYGADTLRVYEMFMGPLEAMKPWNFRNIAGVRRFLERVWKLQDRTSDVQSTPDIHILLHQIIKKVGKDIESLKMNTAISALMVLLNKLEKLPSVPRGAYKILLQLLTPFAPHITHELAEGAGFDRENWETWPAYDPRELTQAIVTVAIQVNGKTRATVELPADASEAEALEVARKAAGKWLSGPEKKTVYIPGRVISFVV